MSDVGKGLVDAASFISSVGVDTKNFVTAEHNLSKSNNDIPINFVKNFTMVDATVSCHDIKNSVDAHVKVGVDANVNVTLGFGIVMAGKMIPPSVDTVCPAPALTPTLTFCCVVQCLFQYVLSLLTC